MNKVTSYLSLPPHGSIIAPGSCSEAASAMDGLGLATAEPPDAIDNSPLIQGVGASEV